MKHVPNLLTLLRLLLVPCFLLASFRAMYLTALAIFVSAAVTDILDGMIARRLNVRSKLGALLDPAADKTLMVCGFLYYTFAETLPVMRIPGWLTFAVFVRDFLIVFAAYMMYTRVHIKRFPPSVAGKASTVVQAVTLGSVMAANSFMSGQLWVPETLFRLSLVMTLISGWDYMRRARNLLEPEPQTQA